jgi:hypothetical protein
MGEEGSALTAAGTETPEENYSTVLNGALVGSRHPRCFDTMRLGVNGGICKVYSSVSPVMTWPVRF